MFSTCFFRFFFRFKVSAIILLILLFVSIANASSYNWKLVAYDDSAKYFINTDHIESDNGTILFWVKTKYSSGKFTSIQYRLFCSSFEFQKEKSIVYENKQSYTKDLSVSDPYFIGKSPIMLKCFELFCGEKIETEGSDGTIKEQGWLYRPPESKDEVKVGRWTYWYDNGVKREELFFKNGKKEGTWTFWNRDGKKWKQQNYKNDLLDGPWTVWHPNGKKSIERNYVNDRLDGKYTKWNEQGKIIQESWYKEGKPVRLPPRQ